MNVLSQTEGPPWLQHNGHDSDNGNTVTSLETHACSSCDVGHAGNRRKWVCRWLLLGAALRTQLHLRTVSPILEIGFRCDRRKPEQLLAAAAGALSVERPSLTSADQQARKYACDHDVICNENTAALTTPHAGLQSCQDRFTPMVPR